jgi:hypothetical protein
MEPLSDRELDELLREWGAPPAPETLKRKVRRSRRGAWWKWLLTGSVRVPVPLTLALAVAFVAMLIVATIRGSAKNVARQPATAGLQPVKRLEVRIIRSSYENNN